MNYTNTQIEAMYLDWFNNFLSCMHGGNTMT